MDSNHRRRKPADLQSAPVGHLGNLPGLFRSGVVTHSARFSFGKAYVPDDLSQCWTWSAGISQSGLHFGLRQALSFFPGGRPAVGVPVLSVLGQSSASGLLGSELFGDLALQAF